MNSRPAMPQGQRITPREGLVLDALRRRLSNAEIAELLEVSVRTVETHVSSILTKLGVTNRRQLVRAPRPVELTDDPARAGTATGKRPVQIALLDRTGTIQRVNRAWLRFCLANGGTPSRVGPGVSYLDVCARSGDPESMVMAESIRAAAAGGVFVPYRFLVPCHSPGLRRWYDVLVSSRVDDEGSCVGVTVALSLQRSAFPQ